MKRILLFFISVLLFSCDNQRYVITEIGDINIYNDSYEYRNSDTIQSAFTIRIDFETLILGQNWNIIPTAQAFSKSIIYLNAIDLSTIKVSIDKDLIQNDQVIVAGEDIPRSNYINGTPLEQDKKKKLLYQPFINIAFPESLLQTMRFQKGKTKFTVTGINSDNIKFKFEKEVYMNL